MLFDGGLAPVKIIHTADWHLCDRLGRIDRTRDLGTRVERVAHLCMERQADVLLIAGDLFYEQATLEQMTEALDHIRKMFCPFFDRNGTILAITGNHDRDARINMVRAGMMLAVPAAGAGGLLTPGRMYLANGRAFCTLAAPGGQHVQFVLVPYPFTSRYDLFATEYRTKEEENRLLHGRVAEWVQHVSARPDFDAGLPTVMVAHLHVRGSELNTLSRYVLQERDDVLFDFADLNPAWAYVALGHVHKPQCVGCVANVRYPGSLDRLDFTETHDDHGVLLVEVGRSGLVREPERLPIPATPFHTITLTEPEAELPKLADRYPDRETAIVKVTVAQLGPGLSRDEIGRQLRRLFPRLYELKWPEAERGGGPQGPLPDLQNVRRTVLDYLEAKLASDPDKMAVAALADGFLRKEGYA